MHLSFVFVAVSVLGGALARFKVGLDATSYDMSSSKLTIGWQEDGSLPLTSYYTNSTFLLCTFHGYGISKCPITLSKSVSISGKSSMTFDLSTYDASLGGNGYYVVQMTTVTSDSEIYVINYTEWVRITGFTGTDEALPGEFEDIINGGSTLGWTRTYTVPASVSTLQSPWMTPYIWQQGPQRYAPFLSTPGSTITASLSASRRHPTSSYSVFTTNIKTLLPYTTATPSPSITLPQYAHKNNPISIDYSGRKPTRIFATPTESRNRRRRWAD